MRRRIAYILGFLIVNSAYLAGFPSPTVFYMANVLMHLGVGLSLMAVAAPLRRRYLREAEPESADGWLNVGRALIQEGDTAAA